MTFHDINPATKLNIMGMFEKGYTPSLAHKELISETKSAVDTDLEFHIALSDRSKIPRRSDFNLLFKTFNEQKICNLNHARNNKNATDTKIKTQSNKQTFEFLISNVFCARKD